MRMKSRRGDRLRLRGRMMFTMELVISACRRNRLLMRSREIACNRSSRSSPRTRA
jgi:hypothetical protein